MEADHELAAPAIPELVVTAASAPFVPRVVTDGEADEPAPSLPAIILAARATAVAALARSKAVTTPLALVDDAAPAATMSAERLAELRAQWAGDVAAAGATGGESTDLAS